MNRLSYITYLLAMAIVPAIFLMMTACGDDTEPARVPAPSTVEIEPRATLRASRGDLEGPVDGTKFPASTEHVFAVSAFLVPDAQDDKYLGNKLEYATQPTDEQALTIPATIPYFLNQPVRTDAAGTFHFYSENGVRYFPEDGSHVYFYAFSPACATQDPNDNKTVRWTLTGREDIMYARDLRGIRKAHGSDLDETHQPQPEFHFEHLLTRLNIRCKREVGFADNFLLEKISITEQPSNVSVDLNTGKLIPSADNKSYDFLSNKLIDVTLGYNIVTTVLIPPTNKFNLYITISGDITYGPLPIDASSIPESDDIIESEEKSFKAGSSYNIDLNFKGVTLDVKPEVTIWETSIYSSPITI